MIPEAKLKSYAAWDLPEQEEEYDSTLYLEQMCRDMARELLQLRTENARLKNAYENRILERRR